MTAGVIVAGVLIAAIVFLLAICIAVVVTKA